MLTAVGQFHSPRCAGKGGRIDTSPLIRELDRRYEGRSVIPSDPVMAFLDALWIGDHCLKCERREVCPDPIA